MPRLSPETAMFGDPDDNAMIEALIAERNDAAKRVRTILQAGLNDMGYVPGLEAEDACAMLRDGLLGVTPSARLLERWHGDACDAVAEGRVSR